MGLDTAVDTTQSSLVTTGTSHLLVYTGDTLFHKRKKSCYSKSMEKNEKGNCNTYKLTIVRGKKSSVVVRLHT